MAVNRKELEAAQAKFNKKYGVDFDIDEFDASISGLAEIGGIENSNQMYKMKFTELYKKAFENFVDRKIDGTFDFMEMINDFDKNIMEPYREERKGEGKSAPKPYGGWKVSEYLASVDTYLNDMPLLKPLYAGQRYREGKLGMSDMRAYVNGLKKKDNVTPGELSTVDCYISALSEANENRSLIAKILNPIGLIIEKIHLWLFKSYLEKQTGGPLSALDNEKYKEIYEISNDTLIAKARETVGNAKDLALSNEQVREAAESQKEQVKILASEITDEQIKTFDQIVYEDPHKENSLDF